MATDVPVPKLYSPSRVSFLLYGGDKVIGRARQPIEDLARLVRDMP